MGGQKGDRRGQKRERDEGRNGMILEGKEEGRYKLLKVIICLCNCSPDFLLRSHYFPTYV